MNRPPTSPAPSAREGRPPCRPGSSSGRIRPGLFLASALALLFTFTASAQSPTRVSSDAPILNWRLPSFTAEGHRESLVRGSEARLLPDGNVDLKDLTLTLFTRDESNRVETILLSPAARVLTSDRAVTGESSLRVIHDQFEATGTGWRYDHETKKVSLHRNVRVVLQAEVKDLLQ